MNPNVTLTLATEKDAELIHLMKYEAFLPLYEIFVYLLLSVLVFVAACGLPLVAGSRGYSLAAECGLLIAVASLVVEDGL